MGKVIYKYKINPGSNSVELPKGAKILSVANKFDEIVVWALVGTNQPPGLTESISFHALPTGVPFDPWMYAGCEFIGTVLIAGGRLVWHVFYEPRIESGEK